MRNNTVNLSGVSNDTWVRIIILALTFINMTLNSLGITYFTNEDINEWYGVISVLVALVSSVWCTWKNNSFTLNAQKADEFLMNLRDSINEAYEEQ